MSGLSAGNFVSGIDFQLFRLSITLTEEGERHTDEIIELCHRAIALLRAEPPQKRIQVRRACFFCFFVLCVCVFCISFFATAWLLGVACVLRGESGGGGGVPIDAWSMVK